MANNVAEKIQAKRKKVEKIQEVHKRRVKERADKVSLLKAAYVSDKDSLVLKDILEKIKQFAAYHTKVAQDGVGNRRVAKDQYDTVDLLPDKRLSEMDKAAGQLEIIAYIKRQLKSGEPSETEKS